ncbi:MAG: hypothetical protein WBI07_02965 [Mobilitalea sp.]
MRENFIPFLISLIITEIIFMNISIKCGWRKRFWTTVARKISVPFQVSVWIVMIVVISIAIQLLSRLIGLTDLISKIIMGFYVGFTISLMPEYHES